MGKVFVAELSEGQTVDSVFALRFKEMRLARSGEPYLALELGDRSGRIRGVLFSPGTEEMAIPAGGVVRVSGRVSSFGGRRRITVRRMSPAEEYDPADFVPSSSRRKDELVFRFNRLRESVRHPGLASLLSEVFGNERLWRDFTECPGAAQHHHAYLGGLLEHTVNVGHLCVTLAALYPRVDRDLLVASALLHDVGKVEELDWSTDITYTSQGRMLGHVVLGERTISRALDRVGEALDEEAGARLLHVIVSHHGELEWGAPKPPCVLEALLLHHADNLDAKAEGFIEAVSGAGAAGEGWSAVTNLFRRPLYVPRPIHREMADRDPDEECCTRSA